MSIETDYWRTLKGLLARLGMLAHNYTWTLMNTGTQNALAILEEPERAAAAEKLKYVWTTHPELSKTGPCPICDDLDGEEFSADEVQTLGYVPGDVHPNCYCTLELVRA
jgi:hypothetical protein